MAQSRRTLLAGTATLVSGISITNVVAQNEPDKSKYFDLIDIKSVNPEAESITFINHANYSIAMAGWTIAFEYGDDDTDQRRSLRDQFDTERTIGPKGTLTIYTGAKGTHSETVIVDPPYESPVISNDGNDIIALFDKEGKLVATSADKASTTSTTTTTSDGDDEATTTTTTEEETTTTTEGTTTTEEQTATTTEEEETTTEETTTTTEETTSTEESENGSDEETTTPSSESSSEKDDC